MKQSITREQISAWAQDHVTMRSRLAFDHFTELVQHYRRDYEDGSSYEFHSIRESKYSDQETVTITINGEFENVTRYRRENFGWKAIA